MTLESIPDAITLYLEILWYVFKTLLPIWASFAILYLLSRPRKDPR